MLIKDIQVNQSNVDIVVEILEIGTVREFKKGERQGRVATATVRDDSGKAIMSLWNEEIAQVRPGDIIHIQNAFVGEWQGEKQITTGKSGKFEIVKRGRQEGGGAVAQPGRAHG